MEDKAVTFTILEDGMYLPTLGGVLPEGEYQGRLVYLDGKLVDVFISPSRKVLTEMGVDKAGSGSLSWNIINDYRAGSISEDRV